MLSTSKEKRQRRENVSLQSATPKNRLQFYILVLEHRQKLTGGHTAHLTDSTVSGTSMTERSGVQWNLSNTAQKYKSNVIQRENMMNIYIKDAAKNLSWINRNAETFKLYMRHQEMTPCTPPPSRLQCVGWWMCVSFSVPINSMEQDLRYQSYKSMRPLAPFPSHIHTELVPTILESPDVLEVRWGWGGSKKGIEGGGGQRGWRQSQLSFKQHTDGFSTRTKKQTTQKASQKSRVNDGFAQ